jgi:hypothetical protein
MNQIEVDYENDDYCCPTCEKGWYKDNQFGRCDCKCYQCCDILYNCKC